MNSIVEFLIQLGVVYAFFGSTSLNVCALISIAQSSKYSRRGNCVPLQRYQHTCCGAALKILLSSLCTSPGPAPCSPVASVLVFTSIYFALCFANVSKIFDVGNESRLLSGYSWTFQFFFRRSVEEAFPLCLLQKILWVTCFLPRRASVLITGNR